MRKYLKILSASGLLVLASFLLYYNSYLLENRNKLGNEAFSIFSQYIDAARNHNIDTLKSLSHQVSKACEDKTREAECNELMDSAVYFLGSFKREDFPNVFADKKQIALLSDFKRNPTVGTSTEAKTQSKADELRYALFFTRSSNGPRVLGFSFCFRDAEDPSQKCFATKDLKKDNNGNGWWDQAEKFFR